MAVITTAGEFAAATQQPIADTPEFGRAAEAVLGE
jgi:hypothetical protein